MLNFIGTPLIDSSASTPSPVSPLLNSMAGLYSNFTSLQFWLRPNFIEEDFEPEMIKGKKRKESGKSEYWKNVSRDIMKKNFKKYLNGLTEREIRIIEKILYKEMKFLGYDFEFPNDDYKFSPIEAVYYGIYDRFKKRYKKKHELKDEEATIRRKRGKLKTSIQNKCRL